MQAFFGQSVNVTVTEAVVTGNGSSRWGPAEDDASGTVVLLAEIQKTFDWWVKDIPYKSVTLQNPLSASFSYAGPAILKFIVDNYHDLPPRMIFLNGASLQDVRPVRAWMWDPSFACVGVVAVLPRFPGRGACR